MFPNLIQNKNFSNNWMNSLVPKIPVDQKPNCNEDDLAKQTNGFREINGKTLPGKLAGTVNQQVLIDIINEDGNRFLAIKSIRKAGTRVGIHIHRYGGYTLILKGQMTDFVQGKPINKVGPNSGYYMPPCTPMSAANLGKEDVELIDIFIGPPGEPYIEILEPDWKGERILRWKK